MASKKDRALDESRNRQDREISNSRTRQEREDIRRSKD